MLEAYTTSRRMKLRARVHRKHHNITHIRAQCTPKNFLIRKNQFQFQLPCIYILPAILFLIHASNTLGSLYACVNVCVTKILHRSFEFIYDIGFYLFTLLFYSSVCLYGVCDFIPCTIKIIIHFRFQFHYFFSTQHT